jgi:hypothetical protein
VNARHSSGENHLFWTANYQWFDKESHFLRLALQPVVFSDKDLADIFYSGVEVI